ncbi:hypothetical protein BGZ46_008688 [Entomortierella lignicola]|nr:hypothetical protein BGZ46_008688 [Entomortierella lignicola]
MSQSYSSTPLTTTILSGGMESATPTSLISPGLSPTPQVPLQNTTTSPTRSTLTPYPSSSPGYVSNSSTSVSAQTLLSIIGCVCLIVVAIYTIHVIRRDRHRRRLERDGQDAESNSNGRVRNISTHRPEDEDSVPPPPQYRAYGQDQPYVDPDMVLSYPEMALLRNNGASDPMSSQQELFGTTSITTVTTTTTTTTTRTSACSSPTLTSPSPVISSTQLPVFSLNAGRYQPIFRHELPGNNDIHSSYHRSSASSPLTTSPTPIASRFTSTVPNNPGDTLFPVPTTHSQGTVSETSGLRPQGSPMSEGARGSGILQPILNRLRSQGPPPYIPMAPEETAPRLPPEYGNAVSQ